MKNPGEQFETEVCSRCRGAGTYSYCQTYGDTCFKCRGKKRTLTARGAAAYRFFVSLCEKSALDIHVGDRVVYNDIHRSFWATVTNVSRDTDRFVANGINEPRVTVAVLDEKQNIFKMHLFPESRVRVRGRETEHRARALEFQKTLTKTGTVRKRPQNRKAKNEKTA